LNQHKVTDSGEDEPVWSFRQTGIEPYQHGHASENAGNCQSETPVPRFPVQGQGRRFQCCCDQPIDRIPVRFEK
jgi:hypothetical protein